MNHICNFRSLPSARNLPFNTPRHIINCTFVNKHFLITPKFRYRISLFIQYSVSIHTVNNYRFII